MEYSIKTYYIKVFISQTRLIFISFFLTFCTENGLFDDPIHISEDSIIKGTVYLSDDDSPEGVYIWLDGFQLSTYTDQDGEFSIELPEPAAQAGEGLTGIFNLYYFVANYQIQSSSILLVNGKIESNQGDVGRKGNIYPPVVLQKLLDIRTEIDPASIFTNYNESIITTVYLKNEIDTVHVRTYMNIYGNISGLVITPEGGSADSSLMLRGTQPVLVEQYITQPSIWNIGYKFSPGFFATGDYQFMPIIEILQEGIPQELLNSLGENAYNFSLEYLNIPFKQTPGRLAVSLEED